MKIHRFALIAVLLSGTAFAQTNTYPFPASGNVGIGTTWPEDLLQIGSSSGINDGRNSIRFGNRGFADPVANNSLSNGDKLVLWNNNVDFKSAIGVSSPDTGGGLFLQASGSNYGNIRFFTGPNNLAAPDERMRITANGNVGIGTASPTALLQVGTTHSNQSLKVGVTGNMANSNAEIRGGLAVVGVDAASASGLGAVAWNYYNNGNSPSWSGALLEFLGSGSPGNGYGLPAANQGLLLFQNVSSGNLTSNGANIYISPGGTVSTSYLTNGNVGIGTSNPTHKLAVNGTIKAKEVIVETTGWSDYVFAEGYSLPPLSEVEAHIKSNKHLPGIPSAAQVAQEGVSIGDMQAKLLAKIEELTLHQIAQEKELAALRTKVARLEGAAR